VGSVFVTLCTCCNFLRILKPILVTLLQSFADTGKEGKPKSYQVESPAEAEQGIAFLFQSLYCNLFAVYKVPYLFIYFLHSCWWFFFLLDGNGIWTQRFMQAKHALYCLNHTSSPFCSGYFGDEGSWTICRGWPQTAILLISDSQVGRIISVIHGTWLDDFFNCGDKVTLQMQC
jgi:hypothetical protein